MRILIADDDRATTVMLAGTLEAWGLEVAVVNDGTAAWAHIISKEPPALAILDWEMPGLDGIEICRRVRAWPLRVPVYLILLTSRNSRQDLVAGLEAGADDYMTKPFDPDELRARIHVGTADTGAHCERQAAAGAVAHLQLLQAHPLRPGLLGTGRELRHRAH